MGNRILAVLLIATTATLVAQQAPPASTPRDLFERARMLDESNQKPADAIVLYEQAAVQAAKNGQRDLAATAHVRIGLIHERLGQKAEAERAFKTVVAQYAEQTEQVRQARERLPAATSLGAPGGFSTRRVWAGQDVQFLGTVSPDGRYVSMVDWNTGGNLALKDLVSGATRSLTGSAPPQGGAYAFYSRISPTGASVIFQWFQPPGSSDLRIVRVDGRESQVVYRNDQLQYVQPFDWSQDGSRILTLFGTLDRTNQIAVISVADRSARVLKTLDWRQPRGMSFSPDGRWIVYDFPQKDGSSEHDIFLLAADGTRETRLVAHPDNDFVLGWAPDGRHVLFGSDRTGATGIWATPVSDGKPAGAASLVRADVGPRLYPMGFSRSGGFYYFVATVMSDVHTATIDAAGRLVGTPAPIGGRFQGENEEADWSPDGRFMVVIRQGSGLSGKRLVIRPADGGEERELRPDLRSFFWPRWSPDGQFILISGPDRQNRPGFYKLDVRTGNLELVARPELGVQNMRPEWVADGKSVVYVRKNTDCSCVVRRDLATGQERDLYRMPRNDLQVRASVSPDGRLVAVLSSESGQPTLSLVPASGGESRVLYRGDDLAWLSFVAWTPDSRDVLVGRGKGPMTVWRVPVDGGDPKKTDLAMDGLRGLRMNPDGRVVFTAGENKNEVWVMENFLPGASAARRR